MIFIILVFSAFQHMLYGYKSFVLGKLRSSSQNEALADWTSFPSGFSITWHSRHRGGGGQLVVLLACDESAGCQLWMGHCLWQREPRPAQQGALFPWEFCPNTQLPVGSSCLLCLFSLTVMWPDTENKVSVILPTFPGYSFVFSISVHMNLLNDYPNLVRGMYASTGTDMSSCAFLFLLVLGIRKYNPIRFYF